MYEWVEILSDLESRSYRNSNGSSTFNRFRIEEAVTIGNTKLVKYNSETRVDNRQQIQIMDN